LRTISEQSAADVTEKRYGQAATACLGRIDAHREQLSDVCAERRFLTLATHHFETIPACREWVIGIPSFPEILTRSGSDAASIFCIILQRWI
jgi:hypothetical protein